MKRLLLLFFLTVPLILGSWVDPDTIDVYQGYARINNSSGYNVADLSGNVSYYVSAYDGFCLDQSGYLYNSSPTLRSGELRTSNGAVYECRFPSLGYLQIQQEYIQSGYTRTAWIDYYLIPDVVPTPYSFIEFGIIIIAVVVFIMIAILIISRGVIL